MSSQSSITKPTDEAQAAESRGSWKAFSASAVGIEMGLCILIGWGAGTWIDGRLGSEPWAMLGGLLFGVVAGFRALYRGSRQAWGHGGPASSEPETSR